MVEATSALVDIAVVPDAPEVAPADMPVAERRPVLHGTHRFIALAIAVALALATGLVLPRGARRAQEAQRSTRPDVYMDREVRETAELASVTLRLERIRQSGPVIEGRFTVVEGFQPLTLREVFVDVVLDSGDAISVEDVRVRANARGFMVTFVLPTGSGRVRQLRLMGMRTVADEEPAPFGVDIDTLWPVAEALEPRLVRVGQERTISGAAVRLVSLLLWHDRIETILDMAELNRTAKRSFAFTRLFHDARGGPALPANLAGVREAGDRVHLDFDGVAEDATQVVLFLGQPTTIIDGPWTWVLP